MLTLLVLFCLFLVAAFVVAVFAGLVAISPLVLLLIALPVIDILALKLIFGRKKKKK